jgi:uncharacterized protein YjbJ (UPF0337 family)
VNSQEIEGKWMQARGEAKRRWARLNDDDLALMDGKLDKLAGRIVELYGVTKAQVGVELEHLVKDLNTLGHETAIAEKKV